MQPAGAPQARSGEVDNIDESLLSEMAATEAA